MTNTCNKTSNNKFFDCPARMDDGRHFTDYRSSSSVDDMIRYSNNVMSNFEYRQFLINNGNNIMTINNNYTKDKVGCGSCDYVSVPFNTECDVNNVYSRCAIVDSKGVGIRNVVKEAREHFNNPSPCLIQIPIPANPVVGTMQNGCRLVKKPQSEQNLNGPPSDIYQWIQIN